jgi:hypothetical protein
MVVAADFKAPSNAERFGASSIPSESSGFISFRVDDLQSVPWLQDALKKYGTVADAILTQNFLVGKLANVERIQVILLPEQEDPVIVFKSSKPLDRDALTQAVKDRHLRAAHIGDFTLYRAGGRGSESCATLDDSTLAFGTADDLTNYLNRLAVKRSNGVLYGSFDFNDIDTKAQIVAAIAPARFIPELLPKEMESLKALHGADWIGMEAHAGDGLKLKVKAQWGKGDVKDAKQAGDAGVKFLGAALAQVVKDKEFREDPDSTNLFKLVELLALMVDKAQIHGDGDVVHIEMQTKVASELVTGGANDTMAKIRTVANRAKSKANLRQIGIAMNDHDAEKGQLPLPAICDKEGNPLLSWRVAILPYIGEEELFKQFKLDEPWDSEHNKKLLEKCPQTYATPGADLKDKTLTYYKVFVGKDAMFDHQRKTNLAGVPAGTSLTIMVIEAGDPVPWTKPVDIPFDSKKPLPKLASPFRTTINIGLADGHVLTIPTNMDEKELKSGINWNVGYPFELPEHRHSGRQRIEERIDR